MNFGLKYLQQQRRRTRQENEQDKSSWLCAQIITTELSSALIIFLAHTHTHILVHTHLKWILIKIIFEYKPLYQIVSWNQVVMIRLRKGQQRRRNEQRIRACMHFERHQVSWIANLNPGSGIKVVAGSGILDFGTESRKRNNRTSEEHRTKSNADRSGLLCVRCSVGRLRNTTTSPLPQLVILLPLVPLLPPTRVCGEIRMCKERKTDSKIRIREEEEEGKKVWTPNTNFTILKSVPVSLILSIILW